MPLSPASLPPARPVRITTVHPPAISGIITVPPAGTRARTRKANRVTPCSHNPKRPAPARSHPARWAAALALLALLLAPARGAIEPLTPQPIAIAGSPIVIAVRLTDPSDRAPLTAILEDTRRVPARLVPVAFEDPAPGRRRWIDPGPRVRPDPGRTGLEGAWLLVLEPPRDAVGQGIWINGRRWAFRWLGDPVREALAKSIDTTIDDPLLNPWASAVPIAWREGGDGSEGGGLRARAEPASASPLSRWRYLLLTQGLSPTDRPGPPLATEPADRELADLIAADIEQRWRRALLILYGADPAMSVRARRALAGAGRFQGGAVAPVWWSESGLLTELLEAQSPAAARDRAASWLATVPSALAWVSDDALPGMDRAEVSVLPTRAMLLAAGRPGGDLGTVADVLPYHGVTLSVPRAPTDEPRALVRGPEWSAELALDPARAAKPPALRLGPLLYEWTLRDLTGESVPPADPACVVLLQRLPGPMGAWRVYAEVVEDPAHPSRVELWVDGQPIRLDPDGPPEGASVARLADRWAVALELPMDAEASRTRIGVVRTLGSGVRTAWPRPVFPWDDRPGSAVIDLSGW